MKMHIGIAMAMLTTVCGTGALRAAPFADRTPKNVLWYFGWNGGKTFAARYQASRLHGLARAARLKSLYAAVIKLSRKNQSAADRRRFKSIATLARLSMRHKGAMYFAAVHAQGASSAATFEMLIDGGRDTAALRAALTRLLKSSAPAPHTTTKIFTSGKTLIARFVAGGPKTAAVVKALGAGNGGGFAAALAQIPRHAAFYTYVDFTQIDRLIAARQRAMASAPQGAQQLAVLRGIEHYMGIDQWRAAAVAANFDGRDFRYDSFIATAPANPAANQRAVAAEVRRLLGLVPASACSDQMMNVNLVSLLHAATNVAGQSNPMLGMMVPAMIGHFNSLWHIHIQAGLLAPLSGDWVAFQARTPDHVVGAPVMVHPLTHPKALAATLDNFTSHLAQLAQMKGLPVGFATLTAGKLKYHTLQPGLLFTPTWAIVGHNIYAGSDAASVIRAATHAYGTRTIQNNPKFAAMRKRLGAPPSASIDFVDTKAVGQIQFTYLEQILLPTLVAKHVIEPATKPMSNEAVASNLTPAMTASWTDAAGWHERSIGPFPGAELLSIQGGSIQNQAIAPMMVAILLPSLAKARELANRAVSSSNERAIILSCVTYAMSNKNNFPPNLGTLIADEIQPHMLIDKDSGHAPLVIPPARAKDAKWIQNHLGGHCDYVYVGKGLTTNAGEDTIVIYTQPALHDGIALIGFGDGHVDMVKSDLLPSILTQDAQARKAQGAPPLARSPTP